jgi:hypothetical protein
VHERLRSALPVRARTHKQAITPHGTQGFSVRAAQAGAKRPFSLYVIFWLCTQERWIPEVFIIFGAVARYRRTVVCSSRDDAHSDNSALHTGAVRRHSGFVGCFFIISPRTGHGSSKVLKILPPFSYITWACVFVRGVMHPYFQWARRGRRGEFVAFLEGLAILESHGTSFPWWRWL